MNKIDSERRAKVFWSGRSQAVRLPKDFRIDADEVIISRRDDALILTPIPRNWSWLTKMPGTIDVDFEAALEADVPTPVPDPDVAGLFE